MNILFYRYNSIYEPDMLDAFKKVGLSVIEITEEMNCKDISNKRRAELLSSYIEKYSPTFVYGINYYPVIAEICQIYNVLYLSQTVDSPVLTLFDKSILNKTNRIFLFDHAQYEFFSGYNKDCIFHLPLASATERFDKVITSISSDDKQRFGSDIAFVGSTYREKDPLSSLIGLSDYTKGFIDALTESCLRIYGYYPVKDALNERITSDIKEAIGSDFPDFIQPISDYDTYVISHKYIGSHVAVIERERTLNSLAKYFHVDLYTRSDTSTLNGIHIHQGVNTLTEMPKVFNLSKINLNLTVRSIESGLSLRCFDILGCGGFLMTNYQSELEDMFVIGKDIETFSSIDELIDKCSYYLSHEDERAAIAQNGYNKVRASHTHIHRIQEMLKTITS